MRSVRYNSFKSLRHAHDGGKTWVSSVLVPAHVRAGRGKSEAFLSTPGHSGRTSPNQRGGMKKSFGSPKKLLWLQSGALLSTPRHSSQTRFREDIPALLDSNLRIKVLIRSLAISGSGSKKGTQREAFGEPKRSKNQSKIEVQI